ncbi:hypothetical protein BZZ01_04990 [Nostocales cyanobacterium HT-58-2]|nr:hypothetical protein BZZ01_04990 [Nostocales cyanobacterium HT-58-2]
MSTGFSETRVPLGSSPSGSGVLHGTWLFDFESGSEVNQLSMADVWWEQLTNTKRQLVPVSGATLCSLGLVNYDALTLSNLEKLSYSSTSIQGNMNGINQLVDNSVFAVRTRMGRFAKVQVLHYDYNLQIRWQFPEREIKYLDVKITLGSTPTWLVTRYTIESSQMTPSGIRSCGQGIFGSEGGIVQGQVSDEGGAFPSTISVTVSIDFVPDTHLTGLVKNFAPSVTDTGVNFFFEPKQVIQNTSLFFDLPLKPVATDYFLVRWKHTAGETVVASGQKYLSADELQKQPVTQYTIVFVPDPIGANDLDIGIVGRYQNLELTPYIQKYELSETAILIRVQKATTGSGYVLVSV